MFADETQRVMAELQARGSSHSESSTPVAGNEIDVDDKQSADQMAEDAKDKGTDDSAKPVIDESGH